MKIKEFVQDAKNKNLKYALLKNWHQPTPHWEDFDEFYKVLRSIDISAGGRISVKDLELTRPMNKFLNQSLDAYPNIDYELFSIGATSFRSMESNTGTYAHTDPHDVLHWHCRGATYWHLGSNDNVDEDTFLLEPGDLLWIKAGTWHKTENITEKYSLIFNAGKLDY